MYKQLHKVLFVQTSGFRFFQNKINYFYIDTPDAILKSTYSAAQK